MSTNTRTVAVVSTFGPAGKKRLETHPGIKTISFSATLPHDEFVALLAQNAPVHAIVLGQHKVGATEIAASGGLEVVARNGVGFDNVDLVAMSAAKVPLMVVGEANSPAVAEQALSMLLSLMKNGARQSALVRAGRWNDRMTELGGDLYHKTLLVVGCGRIGSRTTKRAAAFEMRTLVYDPYVSDAVITAAGGTRVTDLDKAIAEADAITLHCPKTPDTTGLINARRLALMKPSAILINTARGGIVDEAALADALAAKKIAGAGLDVLAEEPPPADHPLFKFENVIFAPHTAGVNHDALTRMAGAAVDNILSVFEGQIIRANVINQDVLS